MMIFQNLSIAAAAVAYVSIRLMMLHILYYINDIWIAIAELVLIIICFMYCLVYS